MNELDTELPESDLHESELAATAVVPLSEQHALAPFRCCFPRSRR